MRSNIQNALEWRYAVKKYEPSKKISDEDFKVLLDSLRMAPSSTGLQPFKFIVVENPEIREKLKAVSWNQTPITDASKLVVFVYREAPDEAFVQKYMDRIMEVRQVPAESLDGYKGMINGHLNSLDATQKAVWSQRQSYIAMGFLLETAALLKIDATPIEGLDPLAYDTILGLSGSGWKTVAVVTLGYRHTEDAFQNLKKVRRTEETLIEYVK